MAETVLVIVLLCAVITALVGWQLIVMRENRKLWSHFADIARGRDIAKLMESHERQLRAERQERQATEARLHRQVQGMAERIAALKLHPHKEGVVDESPGPVPFGFEDDGGDPYSPELHEFVMGVEQQDARELVEEFVSFRRAVGMHDGQILEKLRAGDYDS